MINTRAEALEKLGFLSNSKPTQNEIKNAYKKQALKWHPDKNPDNPTAEENFKAISTAFKFLTNPQHPRSSTFNAFSSENEMFRSFFGSTSPFNFSSEETFGRFFGFRCAPPTAAPAPYKMSIYTVFREQNILRKSSSTYHFQDEEDFTRQCQTRFANINKLSLLQTENLPPNAAEIILNILRQNPNLFAVNYPAHFLIPAR